jgi:hypothetical protein
MIYYIYEVKGIKNGCTTQWEKRSKQNFKKYNIMPVVVETYEYPNTTEYWQIVGDREWQLAELNGYPKGVHYRVAREKRIIGSRNNSKENKSKAGKIGGKHRSPNGGRIGGKIALESGQWDSIKNLGPKARRIPILQYHKDGTKIKEWGSIIEAAYELKLNNGNITRVCKGKLKSCGGFIFRYKEQTHC